MKLGHLGRILAVAFVLALSGNRALAQDAPLPVRVETIPNGYQIFLNKSSADFLSDVLANADEKQLSGLIRDEAKKRKDVDADTAAKLELIAFIVNGQLPAFKKELKEKCGPNGVCIKVTGLQKKELAFKNPRLNRVVGVVQAVAPLLPADAQSALVTMSAMARTTPLMWKIEPLE